MKLWLIDQDRNSAEGVYKRAVVTADSAEEARRRHPNGTHNFIGGKWLCRRYGKLVEYSMPEMDWVQIGLVRVQEIGLATVDSMAGIVCAEKWEAE